MKTLRKIFLGFPQTSLMGDAFGFPMPDFSDVANHIRQWMDRLLRIIMHESNHAALSIPVDISAFQKTGLISMPRIINVTCAICGTMHHTLWDLKMIGSAGRCSTCIEEFATIVPHR